MKTVKFCRYSTNADFNDLIEFLKCVLYQCLALIAQLVERVTSNDEVAGSTPS